MKQVLNINLTKKGSKLVPKSMLEKEQYKLFILSLKNGQKVTALLEIDTESGTKAQLAKIHICISEMAKEQGYSVKEMKDIVKNECGYEKTDGKYESFKGKSKENLSQVIETIIQMGIFININFEKMR